MRRECVRVSGRLVVVSAVCAVGICLLLCGGPAWGAKDRESEVTASNRPMRSVRTLVLTVGQTEGDLRGSDDKAIQAGVDYLHRLGGGLLLLGGGRRVLRRRFRSGLRRRLRILLGGLLSESRRARQRHHRQPR